MAFGLTAPSVDLSSYVHGHANPAQTDPATDLSPPTLVRSRALGADPPPGLTNPFGTMPRANRFVDDFKNREEISRKFAARYAGTGAGAGADTALAAALAARAPDSVSSVAEDEEAPAVPEPPMVQRQAGGEPLHPELDEYLPCGRPPMIQRQGAVGSRLRSVETDYAELMECAGAICLIVRNNPVIRPCSRRIALQGIARTLEKLGRRASSATRSHTLHACAKSLREVAQDDRMDYVIRRIILQEVEELITDE